MLQFRCSSPKLVSMIVFLNEIMTDYFSQRIPAPVGVDSITTQSDLRTGATVISGEQLSYQPRPSTAQAENTLI